MIAVGDARLEAAGAASLIADADARRYVVIRTAPEPGTLRLATPRMQVEFSEFGFGRFELDETERTLVIEGTGRPSAPTITTDGKPLAVTINGATTNGSR
jgi:hypothetical protein